MSEQLEEHTDDSSESELLYKALQNAKKAFDKTFEDESIDAGYFQLEAVGYELSSDFKTRLRYVKIGECYDGSETL